MALPDDYLSRILEQQGPTTLALGDKAFVETRDPRYVSDAYQYFLNQGRSAAPGGITTVAPSGVSAAPGGIGDGGTGITGASAVQPTTVSDPFLASGAAGGERLPTTPMDQAGAIAAMTPDAAYSLPGESDPLLASGAAGGARLPATQATTTLPSGDVFASDDPMLAEKMDYTQQDPTFWENAKNKFLSTGEDVGNFFTNLKNKGEDIARLTGGAIMNMVVPGAGLLMNFLPKSASGAQQKLVADQLVDSGVVLDNVGRIVQQPGLAYDTPENIMAGYNPGETGMQIGDLKIGGGTVQHSAADRIATLEKTKQEKYGGSFFNEDGSPKINPDTGQPTTLGSREAALREFINMGAAEAAGGVRLEDYDPGGDIVMAAPGAPTTYTKPQAGEVIYGTDYFPELGVEDKAPVTIEDVDEGFQTRFTAKDDGRWAGPGEISGVAGTTIVDPGTYMGSTVEGGAALRGKIDRTQPTAPVTGVEGPPSILSPEVYQDPIMGIADDRRALQQELEAYRDPILDMEPAESVDLGNPLGDDRIVSEEQGSEGYPWLGYEDPIMGMVDEDLIDRAGTDPRIVPEEEGLIADKQMAMEFERQQIAQQEEMERAARAREEAAVRASLEAAQRAEAEQRARAREEAAQREREAAAEKAAAEKAAAQKAAAAAAAAQAASRHVGTGDKGTHSTQGSSGGGYSRGDYGGRGHHWAKGGRVRYGNGGIVDLL